MPKERTSLKECANASVPTLPQASKEKTFGFISRDDDHSTKVCFEKTFLFGTGLEQTNLHISFNDVRSLSTDNLPN